MKTLNKNKTRNESKLIVTEYLLKKQLTNNINNGILVSNMSRKIQKTKKKEISAKQENDRLPELFGSV